jgi:hypothetical protein
MKRSMPFGYPSSAGLGSTSVFYVVFVAEEVDGVGDKGSRATPMADVSSSVFSVVFVAGVRDKGSRATPMADVSSSVFSVVFVAGVGDKGSRATPMADVSSSVFSVVFVAEEVGGVGDEGPGDTQRLMCPHLHFQSSS